MGWFGFGKKKAWPLAGVRETLFGDMPADRWPPPGAAERDEPWATFVRAREAARASPQEAIRTLRGVLEVSALEPRHYLQAWARLRELGERPEERMAKDVLGVVVEVPVEGGLDVLAAYADHSARYLNHAGGMVVWDRPDGRFDAAVDALLLAGSAIAAKIGPWEGPRPKAPSGGQARINLLTPSGLHFGQAPLDGLAADPLSGPAVAAATALLQKLTALGVERPTNPTG